MAHNNSDLTDLIGSRICHDLISPLGAISNGLELLSMSPVFQSPEVALINESVEHANARIKFFRIAFGAADAQQSVSDKEATKILQGMSINQRTNVVWAVRGDQPRGLVKLAFLLIQCLESALPWGGNVEVNAIGEEWAIQGVADRLQIEAPLWHLLSGHGEQPKIPAAKVQFALAPITAESLGRRLIVESGDTTIRVRF